MIAHDRAMAPFDGDDNRSLVGARITISLGAERKMASIQRRVTVLADGRELLYFDDADTALGADRAVDARVLGSPELDARALTPTMRHDVLSGEWISMAPARQNRVHLPGDDRDPLAPATAANPSEIPSNYDVAVFENRSPSFGPALTSTSAPTGEKPTAIDLNTLGFGQTELAIGRCEVISFSPDSRGSFGSQTVSRARTIVEALADRTAALSALDGIRQVFPFENRGEEIGVTLHHPHGQIYAYPYITPRTQRLVASVEKVPDLFERILENELRSERVVIRGEHWSAFVPFAARWPIEVHMLPHRHIPDLAGTSNAERDELAVLYRRLLRGIDRIYETPTPYIAAWHQAPVREHRDDIRLMLQLTSPRRAAGKLKYLAGSEAAMGAWVSDVLPEASATLVRDGIERARGEER